MTAPRIRMIARTFLATAALGLAATPAHAVSATWELKGTITLSQLTPGPDTPSIPVGTPFRLLVTFDTAEPSFRTRPSSDGRPGARYEYQQAAATALFPATSAPASLRFALYAGPDCNPCEPSRIPARNGIFVRDNFADPARNPAPDAAYDGYTFFMNPDPSDGDYGWQVIFRDQSANFDLVNVTGPTPQPLPAVPNPLLPQMAESLINIYNSVNNDQLSGRIESVGTPTYGTAYILTGRNCSYPDFANFSSGTPIETFDDCITQGRGGAFNRFLEDGGGAGQGDFSRAINIDFPTFSATFPAPLVSLGTVFGAAAFGGPSALPVVKASSYPTDIARNNGNVQAYQQYRYRGAVRTDMPLVADLTYHILDNLVVPSNPNPNTPDTSIYPGVGRITATLAIIDGRPGMVSAADMAAAGFGHRICGSEASVLRADGTPWPAGAIMGTATYGSGAGESGAQARLINVVRCAAAGEPANADGTVASGAPVSLAPNTDFYVVTTLQTPSRGRWQQAANTRTAPAANGFADASGTLRVTIDPQAPPEVIQQILANVAPTCADCTFEPDYRVDIKPGSTDNAINAGSEGVVPVAVFSGANASVYDIDVGTLKLGDLGLRRNKKNQPLCSFEDVDLDGVTDLMCHFQNAADNWTPGQTVAVVSGKLRNGASIVASDSIRLVP